MTLAIEDFVNELPPTSALSNLSSYIIAENEESPIDEFYRSSRQIISHGSDVLLRQNDFIGRLLVLGLVASVENYARSIISAAINICPISQSCAAEKPVNLGAVVWHSGTRNAEAHSSTCLWLRRRTSRRTLMAI